MKHHRLISRITYTILIVLLLQSCTPFKAIFIGTGRIEGYKRFPKRDLVPSSKPFIFKENLESGKIPEFVKLENGKEISLESYVNTRKTTAFLIIKNDTILYEKYFDNSSDSSLSFSYSMAKSFLSALIGCAIDDGYIESVDQPITDYIPELKVKGFQKLRVKHLLQMTSGMRYKNEYNPFCFATYLYHTKDNEKKLLSLNLKSDPGQKFMYKNVDSELLGLLLSRALKTQSITDYFQARIWEPLGMEYPGLWSIDNEGGQEKTSCCLAAVARDYAKFGLLYLNKGNWNGKQIIPESWVNQSTKIDSTDGSASYYQYQWWLPLKGKKDFMAIGHYGQYIYINPEENIIIVRLGRKWGETRRNEKWKKLFTYLSENIE